MLKLTLALVVTVALILVVAPSVHAQWYSVPYLDGFDTGMQEIMANPNNLDEDNYFWSMNNYCAVRYSASGNWAQACQQGAYDAFEVGT